MATTEPTNNANSQVIRALHPSYYTDESIYQKERENIFFKTWQFACHESEIVNPGDFVTIKIVDQSIFIIRDKQDKLKAFYNVCQHRAHELIAEAKGNKNLITCPYHAWTYDLDGRLKSAPGSRNVPGFEMAKVCLTSVRLENFCGFIFINLDSNAKTMDEWFPGAREDLQKFVPEINDYQHVWVHHTKELCNWKIAVENYNECYHCRIVHPDFTKGVIDANTVDIKPDRGYSLRHTAQAVEGNGSYQFDDKDYNVIFLWPSMSIQIYPGKVVNTYWWHSDNPKYTTVYRGWYANKNIDSTETMKIAQIDKDTTFAEDLPVVQAVQRGLQSRGYVPGPLILNPKGGVQNELSIYTLNQWVREAVDEG